jgi:hypothetical protein
MQSLRVRDGRLDDGVILFGHPPADADAREQLALVIA